MFWGSGYRTRTTLIFHDQATAESTREQLLFVVVEWIPPILILAVLACVDLSLSVVPGD